MRHSMFFIAPLMLVSLFWLSARPVPVNIEKINQEFEAATKDYRLKFSSGQKFHQITDAQGNTSWKTAKPMFAPGFVDYKTQLETLGKFSPDHLTPCNAFYKTILVDRATTTLTMGKTPNLTRLLSNLHKPSGEERRNIYAKNIELFLGITKTPQELIAYGETETQKSLADLANFEAEIIADGKASSTREFEDTFVKLYDNADNIIAAANERFPLIAAHYHKLFLDYDIPTPHVEASRKLDAFYAIGSYTQNRNAFIFYWDGKTFKDKDLDYLMLHELIPGHHLQIKVSRKFPLCRLDKKIIARYNVSFSEGWGAYVETLGEDLGLFQTPQQRLGLLDWQLIRSVRIALDVHIHHDGWSDEQVQAYWNNNMPERLHYLVERETRRMRKMPLQVISYKVGADAILALKTKEQNRLGDDFDIRLFHDRLLRMGPVPPRILEAAYLALEGEANND